MRKKRRTDSKKSQTAVKYIAVFLIFAVWFCGWEKNVLATDYYDIAKAVGQEISKTKRETKNPVLGYALLLLILGSAAYLYRESKETSKKDRLKRRKAVSALPQVGQRRQWVRVRADFEVTYRAFRHGRPIAPGNLRTAKVKDVSAGGMLLLVPEELHINDTVKMTCIFEDKKMELKGRVVRTGVENKDLNTFYVGIKLEDLKEREQDLLAKWVLKRQRETIWDEKNPPPTNCLLCGRPLDKGTKRILCSSCSEHIGG